MAHSSKNERSFGPAQDEKNKGIKPEWMLAREGINLIINDKALEAEKLFLEKPNSLIMYSGYAFTVLMDSLLSFEDEKLNKALSTLREVERRCTVEDGWFKSVTLRVFGGQTPTSKSYADQLETQIILADSQVCIATLTFLQQDITGYLKGGWVLRKAWKIYQKLYKEILDLYQANIGVLQLPTSSDTDALMTNAAVFSANSIAAADWDIPEHLTNGYIHNFVPHSKSSNLNSYDSYTSTDPNGNSNDSLPSVNRNHMKKSISVNTAFTNLSRNSHWDRRSNPFSNSFSFPSISSVFSATENMKEKVIENDVIIRLMGAVSFGYGLFQLGVSLLPPSLIRIVNFFGFSTNRENGLACLMYARLGPDMRSPLATLSLLWYHTIVRPFYAIDGTNVQAGVETSLMLLKESEEEFGKSSLFLFFHGRAYRLNSDIQKALKSFKQAVKHSHQREMKLLCLHEMGWCHLIELQYCEAKNIFLNLKMSSRWSKAFYCYLAAICSGSCDNILSPNIFEELKVLTHKMPKDLQLDEFLSKRNRRCPSNEEELHQKKDIYWRLLVFEMLYLWNALPSCSPSIVAIIISDCSNVEEESDEPMRGLSKLILGCAYNLCKDCENAIGSYRDCLVLRKNIPKNSDDAHVSAYAQFELGALLLKNDKTKQEGISLLQQIGQYGHFDFDQKLHVRIHCLLKQFS